MKMFRFCIEGAEDLNRNGLPEVRVSAQILGFTVFESTVDLSPQEAFQAIMEVGRKLKIIN